MESSRHSFIATSHTIWQAVSQMCIDFCINGLTKVVSSYFKMCHWIFCSMVSQKMAHIKPSNLFSTSIDKNVVISFDETLVNAKLERLAALESDVYIVMVHMALTHLWEAPMQFRGEKRQLSWERSCMRECASTPPKYVVHLCWVWKPDKIASPLPHKVHFSKLRRLKFYVQEVGMVASCNLSMYYTAWSCSKVANTDAMLIEGFKKRLFVKLSLLVVPNWAWCIISSMGTTSA